MRLDVVRSVPAHTVAPGDVVDCVDGDSLERIWVHQITRDPDQVELLGWPVASDQRGRRHAFRYKPDDEVTVHASDQIVDACTARLLHALVTPNPGPVSVHYTVGAVVDRLDVHFDDGWHVRLEGKLEGWEDDDDQEGRDDEQAERAGDVAAPPGAAGTADRRRGRQAVGEEGGGDGPDR